MPTSDVSTNAIPRRSYLDEKAAQIAARAAVANCAKSGFTVAVVITDSNGVPVVTLLRGGGDQKLLHAASEKATTAIRFNSSSQDIASRVMTDSNLAAAIGAVPKTGVTSPGALFLTDYFRTLGTIAVAGAANDEEDEHCAQSGVDAFAWADWKRQDLEYFLSDPMRSHQDN
ncbi:MAG TPA: heme-binding protein [Steroidobacteraceae bacterium]|nr:heme-binding protein [Steroidobacteraceae bacterium]